MSTKFAFAEGETVLCYHGPLIYKAKCLKRIISPDKFARYFIHYTGWNKSWDEWVPESRMLKYNEANLQIQKQLVKRNVKNAASTEKCGEHGASKEPQPSTSSGASTSASGDHRNPKEMVSQDSVATVQRLQPTLDVHVKMPEELKMKLTDDWDIITRQCKVATLPATPNIDTILDNFLVAHQQANPAAMTTDMTDLITGIKAYFNVALGCQLLYRFERPQYKDLLDKYPGASMCELYGGIHLLRLFVKIGPMFSYTSIDKATINILLGLIDIFLKYMVEKRELLLNLKDYHHVSREYYRSLQ